MSRKDVVVQFVRFAIVGVSNTVVSYLLNAGTLWLLQRYNVRWDYVAGNTVSFFLTVLWAYFWNNRFVFAAQEGHRRIWWRVLMKTYASYALSGLVVSNVLSWVWIDMMGLSKYLAPILNLAVTVPLNFFISKYWAYGEKRNKKTLHKK